MTRRRGSIPIIETYRGVGIHDQQSRERIDGAVKPAIDEVFDFGDDLPRLFSYCGDITKPPEARLLAAAMCESVFEICVEERRERPAIDLVIVRARVAGLENKTWRSPTHYGTLCAPPPAPGRPSAVQREEPLAD